MQSVKMNSYNNYKNNTSFTATPQQVLEALEKADSKVISDRAKNSLRHFMSQFDEIGQQLKDEFVFRLDKGNSIPNSLNFAKTKGCNNLKILNNLFHKGMYYPAPRTKGNSFYAKEFLQLFKELKVEEPEVIRLGRKLETQR